MKMLSLTPAALLVTLAGSSHALAQCPFPAQFQLSSLLSINGSDGSLGFVINGVGAGDLSGAAVSSVGDVNGDGIDDLIIGAYAALGSFTGLNRSGASYVVFGAAGVGPAGVGGVINLSSLNGTKGFALKGINVNDQSGRSVASAGDVNGDGIGDLIIGASSADPAGRFHAGESYVVFGAVGVGAGGSFNLSALNGINGFLINGIDRFDYSGRSVSCAGDVNGDGIDDLIIGAKSADPTPPNPYGRTDAGESYVVFGGVGVGSGGVLELSSLNGTNGFVINGIDAGDNSGISVSSAGDINGDGISDLIIGAYAADPNGILNAGESYVVFGAVGVGAGGSLNLSSLNGTNGFVLNGIDESDLSGGSVSSAGDVNGDGIDDLIIGASLADPNLNSYAGESYVVFGGVGVGAGGVFELSTLNGTNGFVINGIAPNDRSGLSVSLAGDVNGDGFADLIIGANRASPNGIYSTGETHVVFGGAGVGAGGVLNLSSLTGTNGFVLNGIDASDFSGGSVSIAGDVNGDGIGDLIIGAPFADPNANSLAGESYVVFGNNFLPAPPDPFALTSPADGASGLALPESISGWSSATIASFFWQLPLDCSGNTFDITIATDAGLFNVVAQASGLTVGQFDLPVGALLPGMTYYWGVTASNVTGSSPSTPPVRSFTTVGPCPGDADGTGIVNFGDITSVVANWLNICP